MLRKRNRVCHLCHQKKVNMAECSAPRCTSSYCFQCIKAKFDEEKKYVSSCWICYACGKACHCDICNGVLPGRRRNKVKHAGEATTSSLKALENLQNLNQNTKIKSPQNQNLKQKDQQKPQESFVKVQNNSQPLSQPHSQLLSIARQPSEPQKQKIRTNIILTSTSTPAPSTSQPLFQSLTQPLPQLTQPLSQPQPLFQPQYYPFYPQLSPPVNYILFYF